MNNMDNLLKTIKQKFKFLYDIAPKIAATVTDKSDEINALVEELCNVESSFDLKIIGAVMSNQITEFKRIVTTESVECTINRVSGAFWNILASGKGKNVLLTKQMESYKDSVSIDSILKTTAGEVSNNGNCILCIECSEEMILDPERSEYICSNRTCKGICKIDPGTCVLPITINTEIQKAKNGTFQPERHYRLWIIHILGDENDEEIGNSNDKDDLYGEKLIATIRKILIDDNEVLQMVNVYKLRKILKQIDRTDLNKNTTKIIKKITGIGPPPLPDEIFRKSSKMFSRVLEIHESIHSGNKPNRSFYPYYIYKILELLIPESDTKLRSILFYIYNQSQATCQNNDKSWNKIIVELNKEYDNKLKFIPTLRFKHLKYLSR